MLYVYLFATILGGLLLGASVAGGAHHGGDVGHGHDGSFATVLFSLRLWTYLLAFGGVTGLLLHFLTGARPAVTAILAASVGIASAIVARAAIRSMIDSGEGGTLQDQELIGKSATVLVPAAKGATGQIRLIVKSSIVDLMAVCADAELHAKEPVIILEVKDGCALVTPSSTL